MCVKVSCWNRHGDHEAVKAYIGRVLEQYPQYENCGYVELFGFTGFKHVCPGAYIVEDQRGILEVFRTEKEALLFERAITSLD